MRIISSWKCQIFQVHSMYMCAIEDNKNVFLLLHIVKYYKNIIKRFLDVCRCTDSIVHFVYSRSSVVCLNSTKSTISRNRIHNRIKYNNSWNAYNVLYSQVPVPCRITWKMRQNALTSGPNTNIINSWWSSKQKDP